MTAHLFTTWSQSSSVAQSCLTLCDPMNRSTPGLPVHHQLPEFTQTHVHWVNRWCHPTISSSVIPFSSCPQSFPASGPFQMSQLFTSGGQSIRVSASTSVLPVNTQDWSPLGERKLTTRLLKRLLTNLSSYGRNPFKYFLYNTGQEATVRTRHGTDWFQIQTVFFDTQ